MRLFTGIDLPGEVRDALGHLIRDLRIHADLNWSDPENLHITTKFIGEWPAERQGELEAALAGIGGRDPIPVSLAGLGWYPNPHQPRVFWVAVRGGEVLSALARETEGVLEKLGIAREPRPYSPHLTLARIKESRNLGALRRTIAALPELEFGAFVAREFHLYLSERHSGLPVYTRLATFPFSTPRGEPGGETKEKPGVDR